MPGTRREPANVQDIGGQPGERDPGPLPDLDYPTEVWEKEIRVLIKHGLRGRKWDIMRKYIEALPLDVAQQCTYYETWILAFIRVSIEIGLAKITDYTDPLGIGTGGEDTPPQFKPGDYVTVRRDVEYPTPWQRPHLRTPGYIHGATGEVERVCGSFPSPTLLALGLSSGSKSPLYRVRFQQKHVWERYEGSGNDTVDVEIYEPWLTKANSMGTQPPEIQVEPPAKKMKPSAGHGHAHDGRQQVEHEAVKKEGRRPTYERVFEVFKEVLIAKGVISRDELRAEIEKMECFDTPPTHGARLVAMAWADPEFCKELLEDPKKALRRIGVGDTGSTTDESEGPLLVAVQNTNDAHNVVVCTLCSCYPTTILGPSPGWYKNRMYRSRVVREPRKVLKEFGLDLPDEMAIRVHDSTADMRYLVVPQRPPNTDGWSVEQLQALVTRDSMIGTAVASAPPAPAD